MKILVVLPRFPYPLEKGDKLRAYHQIVELSRRHDIYLFAVSHTKVTPDQIQALRPYCRDIRTATPSRWVSVKNILRNYFSTKSLQLGYWDSEKARRICRDFARSVQPDVIYNQMVRTIPLVARLPFPKVMDFQDALSMNTERRMEQSRGLAHYLLHFEFKMLRSTEYNSFKIFDALTIISAADRDAIPHRQGGDIRIVRNGVDFDYFSPQALCHPGTLPPAKDIDIVFCGNMQYKPNVDAATFLVNEIMPLVWQRHPEATVVLAGATPKKAVRRLAGPRVTVTGSVPDIRPYYSRARIFVAPMRIGSGLQNKLLEAMSMGTPCITTSLANLALGALHGQHLLIGDTAPQLADAILSLLDDQALRQRLADQANLFVHENFSWADNAVILEETLRQAIEAYRPDERK